MSVFLTGHETLIVLPDYPTEGTGDYGIGAPAYRLRAHGDGCAGYPSTAVATAAPLFCFHGISDCCDLGVMVLSLGTLAYCAACYRPVSHLLKQNDDEKTDL